MRNLINGGVAEDLDEPIDLVIHTKCPEKWLLIDLETGQEYIGTQNNEFKRQWRKINTYNLEEVAD